MVSKNVLVACVFCVCATSCSYKLSYEKISLHKILLFKLPYITLYFQKLIFIPKLPQEPNKYGLKK